MKIKIKLRQICWFVIVINWELLANAKTCITLSEDIIEKHLSTKTPYRAVANWNDDPIKYEGKYSKLIANRIVI